MQVIITPEAQKQYDKLPSQAQVKITKKLELLKEDSFIGKKLGGQLAKYRSIRAWPYRIIYFKENSQGKVFVTSILHRQGAYK